MNHWLTRFNTKKSTFIFMAFAVILLTFKFLVTPIEGLADNGDFGRLMGSGGLLYIPTEVHDIYLNYVNRLFAIRPELQRDTTISSSAIFVKVALFLNSLFFSHSIFDIRFLGFLHVLFFLIGLYWIISYLERFSFKPRFVFSMITIIIFCDFGYTMYFNSFFNETISYVFLVVLIGAILQIHKKGNASIGWILAFYIAAIVVTSSKTQNIIFGLPLAYIGYRLSSISNFNYKKTIHLSLSIVLLLTSFIVYKSDTLLPSESSNLVKSENLYHIVFYGILKDSKTVEQDMKELGLDTKYSYLAGTTAFAENSPLFSDPKFKDEYLPQITNAKVAVFYLKHPKRFYGKLKALAKTTFYQILKLGNFEKVDKLPDHANDRTFVIWSAIVEKMPKAIRFIYPVLLLILALCVVLYRRSDNNNRIMLEFIACLIMLSFGQFVVQLIGEGEHDSYKHLFMFNILFSVSLYFLFVYIAPKLLERISKAPTD